MVKATKSLRRGDVILALDGHKLHTPVKVTRFVEVLDDGTVHVEVQQPKEWNTSPDRWLRNDQAEVEHRHATRSFHGVKFVKQDDGSWMTEDGKWAVEYVDDFETDCEHEHPVRIPAQRRNETLPILREFGAYPATRLKFLPDGRPNPAYGMPRDAANAILEGRKGYLCPGDEVHFYGLWVAGSTDRQADEVVNREDTFADSASHLARYIKGDDQSRA